jgi:CPA2 family monovalent cation:H+ antiporter-2
MFGAETVLAHVILIAFLALAVLVLTHILHQPPLVAYIITGVLAGPSVFALISDPHVIHILGEFGLVMLLFYIGMQIDMDLLLSMWRKVVAATLLMVTFVTFGTYIVGSAYGWSIAYIVLLGFVLSLSSTAVVMRYLETRDLIKTRVGTFACGVLFVQDLAVVPMLIVLGLMASGITLGSIGIQFVGLALLAMLFVVLWRHRLPAPASVTRFLRDREHAVLFYTTAAFGLAGISSLFGLSVGLGAFLAGVLVARHYADTQGWNHLESLKTLLVATFFMSVGVLVDVSFLYANALTVIALVAGVFAVHTLLYTAIFHMMGLTTRDSIHIAALLAQVGEFSFVIALVGQSLGILSSGAYQLIIVTVATSLFVSPLWFKLFRRFENEEEQEDEQLLVPQELFERTAYRWS